MGIKLLKPVTIVLNLAMAVGLFLLMTANKTPIDQKVVGLIVFLISNQIILTLLFFALGKLMSVMRLPGAKFNTYAYHLWPLALLTIYAVYIFVMLRFADYSPGRIIMIGLIGAAIGLTLLCQLGGAIADKRSNSKKFAIRLENAGGALGGFEILGSMTGTYQDGIIVGMEAIPYTSLQSMHRSADSIIIEGHGERKTEIILISGKAKQFFTELLGEKLNMPKREVKSGLNLKRAEPKRMKSGRK